MQLSPNRGPPAKNSLQFLNASHHKWLNLSVVTHATLQEQQAVYSTCDPQHQTSTMHAGARLPPTAHKAKAHRVGPHARERSPPCLRNVFVDSAIDEDSGYNASIASLPHTQREPPARYRWVLCLIECPGVGLAAAIQQELHTCLGMSL